MFLLIPPEQNSIYWSLCLVAALIVFVAALKAPWGQLAALNQRQHAWYGATLGLAFFWLLQVNVLDVLAFHPLAVTTLTLVFGWHLAVVAGAFALLINAVLLGRLGVQFPVELLLNVIVPATVSAGFIWGLERMRVRNVFIFMLGGGFVGAMLSLLAVLCCSALLFYILQADAQWAMLAQYAHLYALMLFPEGFINGAMTSVLIVFYPHLVRTYDDDSYLDSNL
ncbi:energy-coupling factor ABC transporter permease [Pseudoteredinibacter isoporae]|uniref:energy-coupling factor ABC transporter permease n=1 Tax=Pseudoteredinibacter isoporae TaxID=570281 RepID=UPI0031046D05